MATRAIQKLKGEKDMCRRRFVVHLVVGSLLAGLLVTTVWADNHGAIVGIRWQWTQLTETEPASQSVIPDPENYVMVLNADGSANFTADCNQGRSTYTVEGNTISFDIIGSTKAFCGEDSLDQTFLTKVGTGGTWRVENEQLVLELNENAGTMVFANGGPVPTTLPATGGAAVLAPWARTVLVGLVALGTGVVLRRRRQ
jgi:heat shock protein HslJ